MWLKAQNEMAGLWPHAAMGPVERMVRQRIHGAIPKCLLSKYATSSASVAPATERAMLPSGFSCQFFSVFGGVVASWAPWSSLVLGGSDGFIESRRRFSVSSSMYLVVSGVANSISLHNWTYDMALSSSLVCPPWKPRRKLSWSDCVFSAKGASMLNEGTSHAAAGSVRVFEPGESLAIHGRWSSHGGCFAMPNV